MGIRGGISKEKTKNPLDETSVVWDAREEIKKTQLKGRRIPAARRINAERDNFSARTSSYVLAARAN